ncbi:Fic family protein [Candidatus Saccharibacteria bacterium]|nr:Fic family protein [Candidatus Saccharibacteria bacterium]
MKINRLRTEIQTLGEEYHKLVEADPQGFSKILRRELPEAVYNSNAIEGSTLTLKEVKSIIIKGKVERAASVKEIYRAKNLSLAADLAYENLDQRLSVLLILELHKKFLSGVNDVAAGQFRIDNRRAKKDAQAETSPEFVRALLEDLIKRHNEDNREFLEKIAFFHVELLAMRPFPEGNGQVARLLIDKELMENGFPPIIIQNKGCAAEYQALIKQYKKTGNCDELVIFFALALVESLRKYIALLSSEKTMTLGKWAKNHNIKANIASNKAKRQSIPAFRHDGRWRINANYAPAPDPSPWGDFITTPVE